MGLDKFEILFESPHRAYYSGQQMVGSVHVVLNKPKKARSLVLYIQGVADVRWEESRTVHYTDSDGKSRSRTVIDVYASEEVYFHYPITLWQGGDSGEISTGEMNYPFYCTLPRHIPGSFEGKYGRVRYSAKAVIDRPWRFDHEAKSMFTVICPLDLNMYTELMSPIQNSREKTFCCCCCASAPLDVTLSLPAGAAVVGDIILPTIAVENASRVHLKNIKLYIIKTITYRAQGKCKYEEFNVHKSEYGDVKPKGNLVLQNIEIIIPPVPPSRLEFCNIIDIKYTVRVSCNPSGAHTSFHVELPLTIGTVPFVHQFNQYIGSNIPPPMGWNLAPSAPMLDDIPIERTYPGLPPPTFEDAIAGDWTVADHRDNEHVIGEKTFTPRYPVFKRQPSVSQ